jgi:glycosyltransferase involved in cell wall biosynthesis
MDRYAAALARELPGVLGSSWHVSVLEDPRYPGWSRFAARWVAYPRTIDWRKWDVVHVLDHSYAHILRRAEGGTRTVVTVHDLQAFDHPPLRSGLRGFLLRRINRWVLEGITRADACLCDSAATLRSVAAHFPDVATRVRHQPLGVDTHFFIDDVAGARAGGRRYLDIGDEYGIVLHVGSCAPRKGIDDLLAAFGTLASRDSRLLLVQVGGCFTATQRTLIDRMSLAARVRQYSFVPERELPDLYAAADVLVVPSLFEGFGLPVLEAFAVGVPVVSRRHWGLAEFPAELLLPVDGNDIEALAARIREALGRREEVKRKIVHAREWAAALSWTDVARGTAAAYLS